MFKKMTIAVLSGVIAFGGSLFAAENEVSANKPMRTYTFAKTQPPKMDPATYENPEEVQKMLAKRAALVRELRDAYKNAGKRNRRAAEIQREIDKLLTELVRIVENDANVQDLNTKLSALDKDLSQMPLKKVEPSATDSKSDAKDAVKK